MRTTKTPEQQPKRGCLSLLFTWIAIALAFGVLVSTIFFLGAFYEHLMEPSFHIKTLEKKIFRQTDPEVLIEALNVFISARRDLLSSTLHASRQFLRLFAPMCIFLFFSLFTMPKECRASARSTKTAMALAVVGLLVSWGVGTWTGDSVVMSIDHSVSTELASNWDLSDLKLESYQYIKTLIYWIRASAVAMVLIIGYGATILYFLVKSLVHDDRKSKEASF